MALKGFSRKFKCLNILTEEQVQEIHQGTLEVLWVTGVRVEHKKALKLFKKNDCVVDFDNMRVKIPKDLVEECIQKCPSCYHMNARNKKYNLMVGGNTIYFCPFPGMRILDLDTKAPRNATRKEFYDGIKILDSLTNVHNMMHYTPYFGFENVPASMSILESFAAQLRNSSKCTYMQGRPPLNGLRFVINMSAEVGQEVGFGSISSPPLTFFHDGVEAAFEVIEAGLPMDAHFSSVFGGTSPATIAGTLVAGNCEALSAIVLYQLIKPGTKVLCFYTLSVPQDMRTGSPAFGDIFSSITAGAINQIWRNYELPIHNCLPGGPSSKLMDFQIGYEKTIPALVNALTGANVIAMQGGMAGEMTHHPIQAILDDDVAGMIGCLVEGIEVNKETIAVDLINEVGPIPGYFLNKEHTQKWWKKAQFIPKTADRVPYPEWISKGKKSCFDYAKDLMEKTLETYKPEPLTQSQETSVEKILNEAREFYKKNNLISTQEWETYMQSLKSSNYPYE